MFQFLKSTVQIICALILAIVITLFFIFIIGPMEWIEKKMAKRAVRQPSPTPPDCCRSKLASDPD